MRWGPSKVDGIYIYIALAIQHTYVQRKPKRPKGQKSPRPGDAASLEPSLFLLGGLASEDGVPVRIPSKELQDVRVLFEELFHPDRHLFSGPALAVLNALVRHVLCERVGGEVFRVFEGQVEPGPVRGHGTPRLVGAEVEAAVRRDGVACDGQRERVRDGIHVRRVRAAVNVPRELV